MSPRDPNNYYFLFQRHKLLNLNKFVRILVNFLKENRMDSIISSNSLKKYVVGHTSRPTTTVDYQRVGVVWDTDVSTMYVRHRFPGNTLDDEQSITDSPA